MSEFRYTCPSCGVVLKTAAAIAPGKAIKCPKCQTVFRPPTEGAAPAVAPPRPAAAAPPPPRPPAPAQPPRPSAQTPAAPARAPAPPAKPPSPVRAGKPPEAPPALAGSVQIHDHKGEVTLPQGWKKRKPKTKSNSMLLIGCLGGGVLVILVCCGGPIMLSFLSDDSPRPYNPPPRQGNIPDRSEVQLTQEALVGTWTATLLSGAEVIYQFKADGTVQFNQGATTRRGRFTLQGSDTIRFTWTPPGGGAPTTFRVSAFGDSAMTASLDGQPALEFTRPE